MENLVKFNLPKKKFWKNKKIFITGHTSFKGSWLKLWLEYLGKLDAQGIKRKNS